MAGTFDINRFKKSSASDQYERQLKRLRDDNKEVVSIEKAVRGAIDNLRAGARSFVIYGEPQSGKTEMMICLTAKLIDDEYPFVLHLLNDSVDLLDQNLGRFKDSGLAPAARNFTEILDPAVQVKSGRHVVFCKKNANDLENLLEKIRKIGKIVVIDDEADYASPNAKVNKGTRTRINELINDILGDSGIYIGVTATPARLDLNNTFDNDSNLWVTFPPHSKYTGQDHFFPLSRQVGYQLRLLSNAGSDPRYAREALFSFFVNVAYLNKYVNSVEKNYSILVHTSGKKVDHKTDWGTMHAALRDLLDRGSKNFDAYTKAIWELCSARYADADPDTLTHYILNNVARYSLIVLNSERDWTQNSGAATNPASLFTIIIGGNIVSRGVTLNNLLSMFFTRDVKHKIQQDTYIQRARMFGSRGDYLPFFELTIPAALYEDWHRCFVFHRLALAAINAKLGSLVWLSDTRISAVSSSSIDKSTVDLNRGEMSFPIFDCDPDKLTELDQIASNNNYSVQQKIERMAELIGDNSFPEYARRYISRAAPTANLIGFHPCRSISGYGDSADKSNIQRKKGFLGKSQRQAFSDAEHHLFVMYNEANKARLFYKQNAVTFIKNTVHDS
ncbi:MAG TPA: Z1 domain-containing protein [Hyphomicrobium sp.]|nr:Z1 domain-containing protein [Hyphomicrobium sp.]